VRDSDGGRYATVAPAAPAPSIAVGDVRHVLIELILVFRLGGGNQLPGGLLDRNQPPAVRVVAATPEETTPGTATGGGGPTLGAGGTQLVPPVVQAVLEVGLPTLDTMNSPITTDDPGVIGHLRDQYAPDGVLAVVAGLFALDAGVDAEAHAGGDDSPHDHLAGAGDFDLHEALAAKEVGHVRPADVDAFRHS
jgi:hypothetical protein